MTIILLTLPSLIIKLCEHFSYRVRGNTLRKYVPASLLWIRKIGGLLWIRWWTFGFHNKRGISRPANEEWLCTME